MSSLDLGAILAKLQLDASGYKAGVEEAKSATKSFSESVHQIGEEIVAAFSVEKLVEFGKASVEAFADAEKSAVLLQNALAGQGFQSKAATKDAMELAEGLARSSEFTHVQVEASERLLISMGHLSGEGLERAEKAAINLSEHAGRPLEQVTMSLIRAHEGHTTALTRMGIEIDVAKGKQAEFGDVLSSIEHVAGDAAAKAMDTYDGKVKQLKDDLEHMKETIGSGLAPQLETLFHYWGIGAEALAKFIGMQDQHEKKIDVNKQDLDALNGALLNLSGGYKQMTGDQWASVVALTKLDELGNKHHDGTEKEIAAVRGAIAVSELQETIYLDSAAAVEKSSVAHDKHVAAVARDSEGWQEAVKSIDADIIAMDKAVKAQERMQAAEDKASNVKIFDTLEKSADPAVQAVNDATVALREYENELQKMAGEGLGIANEKQISDLHRLAAALQLAKEKQAEQKQEQHLEVVEIGLLRGATDQFANSLVNVIQGQESMDKAMKNLGKSLEQMLIKMAIDEGAAYLIDQIFHRKKIAAAAADAAANSGAAASSLGPEAIAPASAIAYAEVIAWEGAVPAARGGELRGGRLGQDSIPVLGMPGETILDTGLTSALKAMVAGGGTGGARNVTVKLELHTPMLPDRTSLRQWIRDVYEPEMRAVHALS